MNIEHTLAVGTGSVRLGNGINVSYDVQGNPGAEPIVFVHGWPDSGFSFRRVAANLDPLRIRSFAYDQRGFGAADRPLEGYTVDHFASDVIEFLDAVGVERATLVGHSFGSFVARRAAELQPGRVAGLVLIGSAMTAANDVLREVLEAVQSLDDPISVDFVREFQASTLHIPVPDAFFDGLVAESSKAPARVWRDTLANLLDFDDATELRRIEAPTLLVWGERDGLFSSHAEQRRLEAAIPNARLTVYGDTGHSPNWERPERVARDIQTFVL
jgi:pimeloyl-ACP methyl ester carboxylesterase